MKNRRLHFKGNYSDSAFGILCGRTLDNAFVILDEAQNTTHSQMKMFLTRMGKSAKFMITGDPGQVDLPMKNHFRTQRSFIGLKDIDGMKLRKRNKISI
jgi:phosphate starvation-inducible PhoH-like protein